MSGSDLTAFHAGLYGKLPCAGDFVVRGLPLAAREPLDHFLASGLAQLQREQQDTWQEVFTRGLGWHFFAPEGCFGSSAYCGVLWPSQDQVGRLFPIVGLVALPRPGQVLALSRPMNAALEELESRLMAAATGRCTSVDDLYREMQDSLQRQSLPQVLQTLPPLQRSPLCFAPSWSSAEMAAALWLEQTASSRSCWWRRRSDAAHWLVFTGLPSATQFAQMLQIESATAFAPLQPSVAKPVNEPPSACIAPAVQVEICEEAPAAELPSWQDYVDPLSDVKLLFEDDEPGPEVEALSADLQEEFSDTQRSLAADSAVTEAVPHLPIGQAQVAAQVPSAVFALSETGKVRSINEDSFWVDETQHFWLVADGLGGLEQGDVASWAIVEACRSLRFHGDVFERAAELEAALLAVNRELFELNGQQSVRSGSTVVAALRREGQCAVLWAGDSRLYHCSGGRLEQITRDHTDTDGTANRHCLNRAVGVAADLDLDMRFFSVQPGDRLLLCSDGVYNFVGPHSLRQAVALGGAEDCGAALRERIEATEASDNYTLIVVDIAEVDCE